MLGDMIKELRKKQNISQEELALTMHVVRQTISKWEKGLSVPDAEEVIRLAEIFQVSVSKLLGVQERESFSNQILAEKLEEVNQELAKRIERERVLTEAGKVRGYILMLAFAAIVFVAIIKNTVGALIATAICGITALLVLYHNLGLLTSVTTEDYKLRPLKVTTIFNITTSIYCKFN